MDHAQKEKLITYLIDNSGTTPEWDENGDPVYERDALDRLKYNYAVRKIIGEYFDIHQLGVDASDLHQDLMFVALEMSSPGDSRDRFYPVDATIEDDGLVDVFESKINAIKADIGRGDQITFTIWFPWQISWTNEPSTFEVYNLSIERASESDWSEKLDDLLADPDAFDAGRIKRKTEDAGFDYWKTTVTAKSPSHAFSLFSSAFKLLSAKINHSRHFLSGETYDRRQGSIPGHTDVDARWTAIRKPFAVLWEDDRTEATIAPDRGHQGCNLYYDIDLEPIEIDYDSIESQYEAHSSFDWTTESRSRLHNALLGYQDGLVATDHTHSFFSFWQVLEELTLAERQNKESVVNKALFGIRIVMDDEYDPVIDEIADEIWETRNNWVHDPGWNRVSESHEVVAKLLADAMIELHNSEFGDLDEETARRVLKWGAKSEEKRSEVKEAIEMASEF